SERARHVPAGLLARHYGIRGIDELPFHRASLSSCPQTPSLDRVWDWPSQEKTVSYTRIAGVEPSRSDRSTHTRARMHPPLDATALFDPEVSTACSTHFRLPG